MYVQVGLDLDEKDEIRNNRVHVIEVGGLLGVLAVGAVIDLPGFSLPFLLLSPSPFPSFLSLLISPSSLPPPSPPSSSRPPLSLLQLDRVSTLHQFPDQKKQSTRRIRQEGQWKSKEEGK
jgi:hypothetical protein